MPDSPVPDIRVHPAEPRAALEVLTDRAAAWMSGRIYRGPPAIGHRMLTTPAQVDDYIAAMEAGGLAVERAAA